MHYKVIATIPFTSKDEARDFYNDCQLALAKSSVINPGQDNQEVGHISLHTCHHDETPFPKCVPTEQEEGTVPPSP